METIHLSCCVTQDICRRGSPFLHLASAQYLNPKFPLRIEFAAYYIISFRTGETKCLSFTSAMSLHSISQCNDVKWLNDKMPAHCQNFQSGILLFVDGRAINSHIDSARWAHAKGLVHRQVGAMRWDPEPWFQPKQEELSESGASFRPQIQS